MAHKTSPLADSIEIHQQDPNVVCIQDLMNEGNKNLPREYKEYYHDGAEDLVTVRDNTQAFDRFKIRPRVLVNVDGIDTSSTIFGVRVPFPLGIAPSSLQKLAHVDGEVATSRAAAKYGLCMGLSAYSNFSLEDVAAQGSGNPYIMHMIIQKDRGFARRLLQRAEKAGYKAMFLSVDIPVIGIRQNEIRNKFSLPEGMEFPNVESDTVRDPAKDDKEGAKLDPSVTWESIIPWLRANTKLEIWAKGITSPEDVTLAIQHGLDGIVISNHGGRQLDGIPSSIDALRECAPFAAGKIPIVMDGGIRRGSDIFKALALGAEHCFVGRAPIWGLAYNGQRGVELAIEILMREFKNTMALAGCRTIADINKGHLSVIDSLGVLCKL